MHLPHYLRSNEMQGIEHGKAEIRPRFEQNIDIVIAVDGRWRIVGFSLSLDRDLRLTSTCWRG